MFYLKTAEKQKRFLSNLNHFYSFFILLPIAMIVLVANFMWLSKSIEFDPHLINIWCSIILITTYWAFLIIKFLMKFKWRKMMMYEFLEIAHNSKIPFIQPKVVYVYTTCNDFMKARLLQNLEQTYKNIEVWISVGRIDDRNLAEIKQIAEEKNINLCIMNCPSKSKADNLNYFLKNSGATFDYLLIGDADVAFDANFVETSLKIFSSERAKRLGYVSSTIFNYRGNNAFTNAIMHFDNEPYILKHQLTSISYGFSPNIYSACCLISNNMLQDMGGLFPNSNLEDWYMEKYANKHFWEGVISPLSVAMQSFDKTIWQNLNRLTRLFTWGIKYNKEQFFKKYNPKFNKQNSKEFANLLVGPFLILGILAGSFILWTLIIYFDSYIRNLFLFTVLVVFILNLIIYSIVKSRILKNLFYTDLFKRIFLTGFYLIVLSVALVRAWFGSFFLSRYSTFDKVIYNNKKSIKFLLVFGLLVSGLALSLGNYYIFTLFSFSQLEKWLYLIILANVLISFSFLYFLGFIMTIIFGNIHSNKEFDNNKFVYCTNDFVTQKKQVEKFNETINNRG